VYEDKDDSDVHTVDLINSTCFSSPEYVVMYINVTFIKGSIKAGVIIEDVLKDAIKDNLLGDLPVISTQYKVTFIGMYSLITRLFVKSSFATAGPLFGDFQLHSHTRSSSQ